VNTRDHKILIADKRKNQKRLARKQYSDQPAPMFKPVNIRYEISERQRAIGFGGIGAIHTLVDRLGLAKILDDQLHLLKFHLPYHESDHVLNMAYNVMTGGTYLEDIERLRQDGTYTKSLGADRIPDPTTAGDFLRRFESNDLDQLQESINQARRRVWDRQKRSFREKAIVDFDGTIAATTGECKQGMDISYDGQWGYAPLAATLAGTKEVLYLVNRSGNQPSNAGAGPWMEKTLALVEPHFEEVWMRGDTDFSLTKYFDRWDERAWFVFGYDAKQNLISQAEELPSPCWQTLTRPARYQIQTQPRQKPENVKERIVREREYENIRLQSEQVAEFEYQPTHCQKSYRMVVVRKNLSVEKGEKRLFDEIRYFFYITNERSLSAPEVVFFANDRGDQENIIAQLKSGIGALHLPCDDLLSNWAYMICAALAWNLKAWYGLMVPDKATGWQIVKMEFKRFLRSFIFIPCQIITGGRRLTFRILTYTDQLRTFLKTYEVIRDLCLT